MDHSTLRVWLKSPLALALGFFVIGFAMGKWLPITVVNYYWAEAKDGYLEDVPLAFSEVIGQRSITFEDNRDAWMTFSQGESVPDVGEVICVEATTSWNGASLDLRWVSDRRCDPDLRPAKKAQVND